MDFLEAFLKFFSFSEVNLVLILDDFFVKKFINISHLKLYFLPKFFLNINYSFLNNC